MDKFGWSLSSSSPIGKNSDDEGGENEAESSYKGPLDMMESLEEVLPIRRGISKFYKGKSKSFTNLNNTESLSMKDLGKPDNLYSRHRRNLLRHRLCSRGGISKKPLKANFTVVPSCGDDSSSAARSFETSALTDTTEYLTEMFFSENANFKIKKAGSLRR